jgi:predicted RNA methylase
VSRNGTTRTKTSFNHRDNFPASSCKGLRPWRHNGRGWARCYSDLVRFLDIGTGSGWLAIEAALSWPALRVVGVDPWEPALVLARRNLAQSGVAERVELRAQHVELLMDEAAFTVAWLPGPFIAAEIADRVLDRLRCALALGGSVHWRERSRTCGLSGAAAIRGPQEKLRRSFGQQVSSKSKCTLPHPRSCSWSGGGQLRLSSHPRIPRPS